MKAAWWVAAGVAALLAVAVLVLVRAPVPLVAQHVFYDDTTAPVVGYESVLQVVTVPEDVYATGFRVIAAQGRGKAPIEQTAEYALWDIRPAAELPNMQYSLAARGGTVTVDPTWMRAPLSFVFGKPLRLSAGKRYGLWVLGSPSPAPFRLMRGPIATASAGQSFQGSSALPGALVFRIDGRPVMGGTARSMLSGPVRPAGPAALALLALVLVPALGVLLAGAASAVVDASEPRAACDTSHSTSRDAMARPRGRR